MTIATSANLDEVLNSFAVSGNTGDPKALQEWISLYPEFERQLRELAARPPPDEESLPPLPGEKARIQAGVKRLAAILDKLPASAAPEPIAGLVAEPTKRDGGAR